MLNISQIRVRKTFTDGRVRAIISVTFDDCLAIHDIKVIQNDDRLFVAMPSRMDNDGVFHDVAHPIDMKTRQYLEDKILSAYDEYINDYRQNI